MSITDELREWAEGNALCAGMSLRTVRDQALAIADRIDAEHEEAEHFMRKAQEESDCANEQNEDLRDRLFDAENERDKWKRKAESEWQRGYDEGYASADDWLAEHEDAMAEHGYYRAIDASGEVIHAGDEFFLKDSTPVGRVVAIGVGARSDFVWSLRKDTNVSIAHSIKSLRRRRELTVEDVLAEFAAKLIERNELTNVGAQTIAEYAAKLQLRCDAE